MSTKIRTDPAELADKLHSAAIHLLRKLRREDESSGLNAPRLSALSVIVFGGPLSLGDLAAAEQVRPPTMTRIVNALEVQGLVTKQRDETDGRSIRLAATSAGKALLMEGRKRRVDALAKQIASLSADDQRCSQRGQPNPRRSHPRDPVIRDCEFAGHSRATQKQKGEISCETPPSAIRILEDPVSAPDHNRAVPQSPGRREQARYLLVFRFPPVARASVATACLRSPKPGCPILVARSEPCCQVPSWFDFRSLLGRFLLRWF